MNAIDKALEQINRKIPKTILKMAFPPKVNYNGTTIRTVDDMIRSTIIKGRVMLDMSLVGGQEQIIDLTGLPHTLIEGGTLFHVPLSRTGGREILQYFSIDGVKTKTTSDRGGFIGGLDAINDQVDGVRHNGTANIQHAGVNRFIVRDLIPTTQIWLTCRIADDPELNNIQHAYWSEVAELAVWATKEYIYNELGIIIGDGNLNGGETNSGIVDRINEYADAGDSYDDALKEWPGYAMMNDPKTKGDIIRQGISRL